MRKSNKKINDYIKLSMMCNLFFLLFLQPNVLFASSRWNMPTVDGLQADDWSCGVQSAYRLLAAYNQKESYESMKNNIGSLSVVMNINYVLQTTVEEEVCEEWAVVVFGPTYCLNTITVTKTLEEAHNGGVSLDSSIGKPDKELIGDLQRYRSTFKDADRQNLGDVLSLLDHGRPVMAMIQTGTDVFSLDSYITTWLLTGWTYVGPTSLRVPHLHWILMNGYDNDNIYYYYDTTSNSQKLMSRQEFLSKWGWEVASYDEIVRVFYEDVENMHPRTIVWIDEELPILKAIPIINSLLLND